MARKPVYIDANPHATDKRTAGEVISEPSAQDAAPLRRFLHMTVVSQPTSDAPAFLDSLRVVLSAEDATIRARIATALGAIGVDSSDVATKDLFGLEADPKAIVVLTCDLDAPSEMALLRRLQRELPGPSIVAVSPQTTGAGVRRALEAGADAVVFESELEATVAVAVSAVASGQSVVPRKVRASVERPALSHRERQVLSFVTAGMTNAEIAEKLFLSESTIKSHLSSVFTKLSVRSRREAAALFRELERAGGNTVGAEGATA
jgi:DNA-binding NarL/FixJ family response regulator